MVLVVGLSGEWGALLLGLLYLFWSVTEGPCRVGVGEDTVGIWDRETWERRISWEDSTNGFSNLHMMERRDSEAETEWVERRRSS